MTVEWEEPPQPADLPARGNARYGHIRAACKANPKRWAICGRNLKQDTAYALVSRVRNASLPIWRGPWEVRRVGGTVWIRWMGDAE